ncbi:MAG: hypothetical protein AB7D26_10575 [Marinobacterium sp.]
MITLDETVIIGKPQKPKPLIDPKFQLQNQQQMIKLKQLNETHIDITKYHHKQEEIIINYPRPEINEGHEKLLKTAEKLKLIEIHTTQEIENWPTRKKATITIPITYEWGPPNPLLHIEQINKILHKPINTSNDIRKHLKEIIRRNKMTEKHKFETLYEDIYKHHEKVRNIILTTIAIAEDLYQEQAFDTHEKQTQKDEITKPTAHAIKEIAKAIGHAYTIPKKLRTPLNEHQEKIKNKIIEETLLRYI